jgi:hypothetical protein
MRKYKITTHLRAVRCRVKEESNLSKSSGGDAEKRRTNATDFVQLQTQCGRKKCDSWRAYRDRLCDLVWRTDEAQSAHREPELLRFIPSNLHLCLRRPAPWATSALISFVSRTRRASSTCANDASIYLAVLIAQHLWNNWRRVCTLTTYFNPRPRWCEFLPEFS